MDRRTYELHKLYKESIERLQQKEAAEEKITESLIPLSEEEYADRHMNHAEQKKVDTQEKKKALREVSDE